MTMRCSVSYWDMLFDVRQCAKLSSPSHLSSHGPLYCFAPGLELSLMQVHCCFLDSRTKSRRILFSREIRAPTNFVWACYTCTLGWKFGSSQPDRGHHNIQSSRPWRFLVPKPLGCLLVYLAPKHRLSFWCRPCSTRVIAFRL